jgi:hypothetical protein
MQDRISTINIGLPPIVNKTEISKALDLISNRLSLDEKLLNARTQFSSFNEYLFEEVNNIHHIEVCNALDSWEDTLGILPRNSGKSTICSTRYPAYRLGQDRALRIIVCSSNATLAQTFLRSIDAIISSSKYKVIFGDLKPSGNDITIKWNETEKIVSNRPDFNSLGYRVDAKDVSLFAVGVGGTVIGRRADIIIMDDIIDRKTVKTQGQLDDIINWYNEELKGVRHAHTQMVVLGTRWSSNDIYMYIMNNMLKNEATLSGNMINEVKEQVQYYNKSLSEAR